MEFFVAISVQLPGDLLSDARAELLRAEQDRGAELVAQGTIQDIWRVPGRQANVGIWSAPDATALHDALASLPVFRWATIDVTPLARHPLRTALDARG
jgi:muconolactone D-isomerase